MNNQITASVDTALLQEKANEYATKGALKAIEEFYSGYDSPYKKQIMSELEGKSLDSFGIKLPDIVSHINEHLTAEIDSIANTAIAKTFVPLVAKFLTRQEKEANFSDILKQFIETSPAIDKHYSDFDVNVNENQKYGWLSIHISDEKREYDFTLHTDYQSEKQGKKLYKLLGLPTTENTERRVMKLSVDGATLELPFTRNILQDQFVSYLAGYIISDTIIAMDTNYFEEEMFPDSCHCH